MTCMLEDVVVCRDDDVEVLCEPELALLVLAAELEEDIKKVLL